MQWSLTRLRIAEIIGLINQRYFSLDRRFQPPAEHPSWHFTYDASGPIDDYLKNIMCIQPIPEGDAIGQVSVNTIGSEDCLYLNVWVPGGVDG